MRPTDVDQMLPNITGMFMWLSKTKSMTFGRSKTVSNILIRCPIASDEINTFCVCVSFHKFSTKIQEITQTVDLVRSDGTSYEDIRYGFGTSKGHTSSIGKSKDRQEHPCDVVQLLVNICWPHCWLRLVEIWVLLIHLRTCSSSGWVLMSNIFLESESMDHQFSNALSTMFLRHLVMFLHFETYALANPQKASFCRKSGCELDFLPHIYNEPLL